MIIPTYQNSSISSSISQPTYSKQASLDIMNLRTYTSNTKNHNNCTNIIDDTAIITNNNIRIKRTSTTPYIRTTRLIVHIHDSPSH